MSGLRTFSHGGGVQSTAALVLSAQGKINFPVHLFANVGDDSEHPDTLSYVHDVSMPFAKRHGIELLELRKVKRDGSLETLYGRLTREGSRSFPIPVRMSDTGAPGTRTCTIDFKIKVLARWHREHGTTAENPASVGIGFSVTEAHRMTNARARDCERVEYPLIDLNLRRIDCYRIIADAGLPKPPKSACYFCPFHRPMTWAEMRRDRPDLFEKSAALEDLLNERRKTLRRDPVYLTRYGRPLRDAVAAAEDTLFDDGPAGEFETCDEGVCFV